MKNLSYQDVENFSVLTRQFYACPNPAELRRRVVQGVAEWIGADRVSFEHLAPTLPRLWAVCEPDEPYQPDKWKIFLTHLRDHPAIAHYRRTGNPSAVKISDFVTRVEWHRTQLYQQLYRGLGIEDQMGACLGPPNREFYAIVLSRARRDFSERDRAMLNLLRPHIAEAHANARAMARLQRLAEQHDEAERWLNQTAILVNRQGRILDFPAKARRWLKQCCSEDWPEQGVSESFEAWLRCCLTNFSGGARAPFAPPAPLVRERNGVRLVCRFRGDRTNDRFAIVLEFQTVPDPAAVRALGLTPRQVEILLEVEKGKSNDEIAAALFISPLTVRTHLDNTFGVLGVSNRTSAIARLRQMV